MNLQNQYDHPIRNLQTMLQAIGRMENFCDVLIPDGIFSPETMSAVSAFQRGHSLPVTGVVNQQTWDEIVRSYEDCVVSLSPAHPLGIIMKPGETLSVGLKCSRVYLVQAMLQEISEKWNCISPVEVNGIMDETTCTAVEQLQGLCGLPVSGEIDKMTWKNLVILYPLAFLSEGSH